MTNNMHRIDALSTDAGLHSYRINQVLGSGAFGITYLARHLHLGSLHVIKEYLPDCAMREHNRSKVSAKSAGDKDLFDWGLKCFFDEAKLLHQLSHPHIVKVTDLFEANGTAYFVMPYLRGTTLHEWLKKHPDPFQNELEAIFVPLLEGLKYIHDRNLLHRDIKPENIYILENDHPILIDFGSARIAIGEKSKALTQVLTPHFAPWEQYRSKGTFTPALDLYSLAACMYQAITGRLPEEAPERIEEDLQPKLAGSEHEKWYSPYFLRAIDKSLSVYAKDRHQDGFDLQKDLVGTVRVELRDPEDPTQPVSPKPGHSSTRPSSIPKPQTTRFIDNGDGTVTDTQTGLMWTRDADLFGKLNWNDAMARCSSFNISGFGGWRLPEKDQLKDLYNAIQGLHPFTGVQSSHYWSSSSTAFTAYTGRAWGVGMNYGDVGTYGKAHTLHVWPVRAG